MDSLEEVYECLAVFLKTVLKPDVRDDFDVKSLLKVSRDHQISAEEIMRSVGKLIDQLQTVRTHLTKKIKQDKEHTTEVPHKDTEMETAGLQSTELTDPPIVSMVTDTASDLSESVSPPQSDCRKTDKLTAAMNVQIKASKEEVDRRINAFIEQKESEVNQQNNREFCSVLTPDAEVQSSCARTDAVFVPRAGCKSHIKISRVVNPYGPQTRLTPDGPRQRFDMNRKSQSGGFEERMRNIEAHLKLPFTDESKSDVYTRLKALEDRILFLEGLSPEYFQNVPVPKRQKEVPAVVKDPLQEMSLQDIDDRIQVLQSALKLKRPGTGWLH